MCGVNEVSQFIVSLLRVVCESRFRVKEIVDSVTMVYLICVAASRRRLISVSLQGFESVDPCLLLYTHHFDGRCFTMHRF
jgi:hypothetical protein